MIIIMDDCIFCKIAKGENEEFIYEDDNFFAILDISPITEGHVLVIPKKHFETILDMPNSLGGEFVKAIKEVGLRQMEKYKSEGFNVIMNSFEVAGQVVPHLHAHIVPRKKGDGMRMIVNLKKIRDSN